jgi:hypothetical protein
VAGETADMTFMDKMDKCLTKLDLMSPLLQFDRYLHRHRIEHAHPMPNLIVRTKTPSEKVKAT